MTAQVIVDAVDKDAQLVLEALLHAAQFSLQAHVPISAVLCKFARDHRGAARKDLIRIARMGLVVKHPTKGGMTWQLTRTGLLLAREIELEKGM